MGKKILSPEGNFQNFKNFVRRYKYLKIKLSKLIWDDVNSVLARKILKVANTLKGTA